MSKIIRIFLTPNFSPKDIYEGKFDKILYENINKMQDNKLEVEIQYQFSDEIHSVLIIGREKE